MHGAVAPVTGFDYDAIDRALDESERKADDEKNTEAFCRLFNILVAELIPPSRGQGQAHINARGIGTRLVVMAYFCNAGAIESQPLSELAARMGCTKQALSRYVQGLRSKYGFEPFWLPTEKARAAQRKAAQHVWEERKAMERIANKVLAEAKAGTAEIRPAFTE